jgi:hypothetical protein
MIHLQYPTNLQPVCEVPGCTNGAQLRAMKGKHAVWMKTCKLHTYLDLEDEQQDTFWPPNQT